MRLPRPAPKAFSRGRPPLTTFELPRMARPSKTSQCRTQAAGGRTMLIFSRLRRGGPGQPRECTGGRPPAAPARLPGSREANLGASHGQGAGGAGGGVGGVGGQQEGGGAEREHLTLFQPHKGGPVTTPVECTGTQPGRDAEQD